MHLGLINAAQPSPVVLDSGPELESPGELFKTIRAQALPPETWIYCLRMEPGHGCPLKAPQGIRMYSHRLQTNALAITLR